MRSQHYKKFTVGGPGFRRIREELEKFQWSDELGYGFVVHDSPTIDRISGVCTYTAHKKLKDINPETGEAKDRVEKVRQRFAFELDQQKSLVRVDGKRGDLAVLYELLDQIPLLPVAFDQLNLNLRQLMEEVQGAYKKHTVHVLKIADYLAREHMLSSKATFKMIEPSEADKIADKFSDQLEAFVLKLKLPDGVCSLRVDKRGSVSSSDDAPDELLLFVKDLLPRFDEAEVETVEVEAV